MLIVPETSSSLNGVESSTENKNVDIFVDWLIAKFSKGGTLPEKSSSENGHS
jgi:hypothetical protein